MRILIGLLLWATLCIVHAGGLGEFEQQATSTSGSGKLQQLEQKATVTTPKKPTAKSAVSASSNSAPLTSTTRAAHSDSSDHDSHCNSFLLCVIEIFVDALFRTGAEYAHQSYQVSTPASDISSQAVNVSYDEENKSDSESATHDNTQYSAWSDEPEAWNNYYSAEPKHSTETRGEQFQLSSQLGWLASSVEVRSVNAQLQSDRLGLTLHTDYFLEPASGNQMGLASFAASYGVADRQHSRIRFGLGLAMLKSSGVDYIGPKIQFAHRWQLSTSWATVTEMALLKFGDNAILDIQTGAQWRSKSQLPIFVQASYRLLRVGDAAMSGPMASVGFTF